MAQSFNLKDEYLDLLMKDTALLQWVTDDILNGVCYINFSNPKELWISDSFWNTLSQPVPEAALLRKQWKKSILKKDRKRLYGLIKECQKNPTTVFNEEFLHKSSSGSNVILNGTGITIIDEENSPKALLLKFKKIDGAKDQHLRLLQKVSKLKKGPGNPAKKKERLRKNSWEALGHSSKFMKAFEFSPNAMGVVAMNGDWLMVNKNLSRMIGYTKEELLMLNISDITHPEDLTNDSVLLRELLSKERDSYAIGKRYLHKDGSIVPGLLNVSLVTDDNGKPLSLIGHVVDMTESLKTQQQLQDSLDSLQSLLDATTQVSIIETDTRGVIRKFNKGAENLLGYKAEDVIGKLSTGLWHDKAEIESRIAEITGEVGRKMSGFDVLTYKARAGDFESREWTYVHKNGNRFTAKLVVTPVRNKNGQITGYMGVATDISDLKEMEVSLRNAKLKAEAANKSKSEFLANMSHEIRTPLNGVIGFTDLLMQTKLSDVQEKYMRTVYTSAHSLLDLLNDILDFSKIEAGKLELNKEKTDLAEICGQTIDIIKHQAHAKGLEVLLNISPKAHRIIYADDVRLRQILTNLLGNALKFTEIGEIELKIETLPQTRQADETLFKFSIRDTGIGIAPGNLKKIFYAFDQEDTSTTRKYGGSGLGITISNKLLRLMGSELKVESTIDQGSIFSFEVAFKTLKIQEKDTSPQKNVKNVLVVDDNDNNRSILKEMLAVYNINSTLAPNSIAAIDILAEGNAFDLAIIDYHMPYMNGLDLIKHIREQRKMNADQLPVILLHSSGDDETINSGCKEYHVQHNVVKPIQVSKLSDLIGRVRNVEIENLSEPENNPENISEKNYKILIAEDNPVNKYLSRTILGKILPNAILLEADNGLEAVEIFSKESVDLIFMDIQMPKMSGYEATQKIRSLETADKRVPIIALTARTVKGEKERGLEYGMDNYLTKPVQIETVKAVLQKHLINHLAESIIGE